MPWRLFYLELLPQPGQALAANPRIPVGERSLRLGRAPDNDLVLPEETVSGRHATVELSRGAVRVRDLGSTNGTWVGDVRVDGEAILPLGEVLRVGLVTRLRLGSGAPSPAELPAWRLEVIETGASVAVPVDGLLVGTGPNAGFSLVLEGIDGFTVLPCADGADLLVDGREARALPGAPFTVGGLHFRLLPGTGPAVPTVGTTSRTDGYRLRVTLQGAAGPEAVLQDPARGLTHRIGAENRSILLYVLASRLLDDRAAKLPADRQGWCGDEEVALALWGRDSAKQQANNLNVLVHRLRRELEEAGFDTSFLEKRSRALRARLVFVTVE